MGLDSVELVMEIENEFKVDFKDEELEAPECASVGGFFKLLVKKLEQKQSFAQNEPHLSEADIYEKYIDLISDTMGIDKNEIKPESKFVADLGID